MTLNERPVTRSYRSVIPTLVLSGLIAASAILVWSKANTSQSLVMLTLAAFTGGAVSAMAKIIGEEEFSLLFHKGKKENIHFSRVAEDFLMVSIFGNDVSLGFLRLKVAETIKAIRSILAEISGQ